MSPAETKRLAAMKPYQVRQACGCIAVRMMSDATARRAGWTQDVVIDNGASPSCEPCRAARKPSAVDLATFQVLCEVLSPNAAQRGALARLMGSGS